MNDRSVGSDRHPLRPLMLLLLLAGLIGGPAAPLTAQVPAPPDPEPPDPPVEFALIVPGDFRVPACDSPALTGWPWQR